MKMKSFITLTLVLPLVTGCGAAGRLSSVGKAPRFTPQEELAVASAERSIARPDVIDHLEPQHSTQPRAQASSASLFREGAGGLFRDQRARALAE
jgi:flagellar L-ring protein precursor FlgH